MKNQLPKNGTSQPVSTETEDQRFKQKCKDLKKRILEVEENNEIATIALSRTKIAIRRLRLEYAILLERLEERAIIPAEDSDSSTSDPPSPPNELTDEVAGQTPVKATSHNGSSAAVKKGKRGGSKNARIRDPDLPKRPTNAYLIFCELEKENIRQDLERRNPGVVTDLSRGLTDSWKALDDNGRKPYYRLYEEDKERYVKEMNVYSQKKQEPGAAAPETASPLVKKTSHKRQKLDTENEPENGSEENQESSRGATKSQEAEEKVEENNINSSQPAQQEPSSSQNETEPSISTLTPSSAPDTVVTKQEGNDNENDTDMIAD